MTVDGEGLSVTKPVGAVLVVEIDVEPEFDDEFNRWYDEEHIPERTDMPGFVSAQRFRHPDRANSYLAIYELESADAATSDWYMSREQTEWAKQIMPHWTSMTRTVWPAITAKTSLTDA